MERQPVFVRRTVNGAAYWILVPSCVIRAAVWAALCLPIIAAVILGLLAARLA